jgi:uncharacterized protein
MPQTERTTIKRLPDRGRYDAETLYSILDEAPICTVSYIIDGRPFAIPTIHARVNDTVYLHGSTASRTLGALSTGAEVCLTATIIDGLVVARSAFHSSMNYRSACVVGAAHEVTDQAEKLLAMQAVTEHVLPGRWDEARPPTPKEIAGTRIVAVSIEEAAAKVRTGPPIDDEEDLDLPIWAGVIPLRTTADSPVLDTASIEQPASVRAIVEGA